jgi:(5-formylfuran-3-yl)methyl phosphate synthase
MELLVSVRSGAEVESALAGGADIIDAKEPARGSLGPVSDAVLAEILAAVPGERALSIALGDFSAPDQLLEALVSRPLAARPGPLYLKLGFAGVSVSARIESMIAAAVTVGGSPGVSHRIVVVAYADSERAQTAAPDRIREIAAECGAWGVLLDTWIKDGRGLLGLMDQRCLAQWVERGKDAGLLTALAGELKLEDIEPIGRAGPAVVGVRGAACDGGRGGTVNASRVRALRDRAGLNFGVLSGGAFS